MNHIRKIILIFTIVSVVMIGCQQPKEMDDCLTKPDQSYVILHFSSLTDTTVNRSPEPMSYFYYYDKAGEVLKTSYYEDEVLRDIILEGHDDMAYLMKNESIIVKDDETKTPSTYTIDNIRFGPSQTGYLPEKNVYYSLLNYGQKTNQPYINLVRFSGDVLYDVAVPYYLENITYDESTDIFYCIISPLNKDISMDLSYTRLVFNEVSQQYEWDESIVTCDFEGIYDHLEFEFNFRHTLASHNKLYSVYVADTESYLNDTTFTKVRETGDLILSTYDIKTKALTHETLLASYDLGESKYGVLSGHADFPMSIQNDAMYVFTTAEVYYKIDHSGVEKNDLHYVFDDALNLFRPKEKEIYEKKDFFNTVLSIENDQIYVMILSQEKQLELYKLINNDYELIWTAPLPENIKNNMFLNTFEIIDN